MALSQEAERKLFSALGFSVATEVISACNSSFVGTSPVFSASTDATHLGFFGVTAAARPSAYTQTYATASRTHANLTSAALTDSSTGTGSGTLAAMTGVDGTSNNAAPLTATKNAVASLAAQVNALITDLANVKQVLNSVVDDLQNFGLLQ